MSPPSGRFRTFRLDGETFAVDVDDVAAIIASRPVTRLPGGPEQVLGLVSWQGRTVPVLAPRPLKRGLAAPDLRRRLLVLRRPEPCAIPIDEAGRIVRAEVAGGAGASPRLRVGTGSVLLFDPALLLGDRAGVAPSRSEGRT